MGSKTEIMTRTSSLLTQAKPLWKATALTRSSILHKNASHLPATAESKWVALAQLEGMSHLNLRRENWLKKWLQKCLWEAHHLSVELRVLQSTSARAPACSLLSLSKHGPEEQALATCQSQLLNAKRPKKTQGQLPLKELVIWITRSPPLLLKSEIQINKPKTLSLHLGLAQPLKFVLWLLTPTSRQTVLLLTSQAHWRTPTRRPRKPTCLKDKMEHPQAFCSRREITQARAQFFPSLSLRVKAWFQRTCWTPSAMDL